MRSFSIPSNGLGLVLVTLVFGICANAVPELDDYPPVVVHADFQASGEPVKYLYTYAGMENDHPHYVREGAAGDSEGYLAAHLVFSSEEKWSFCDSVHKRNTDRAIWDSEEQPALPPGSRQNEGSENWIVINRGKMMEKKLTVTPAALVTCGSVIKIENDGSKGYRIFGSDLKWPDSHFAAVAAIPDYKTLERMQSGGAATEKNQAYFKVIGAYGESTTWETCEPGTQGRAIRDGMVVRLQHLETSRYLHADVRQPWNTGISDAKQVSLAGGKPDPQLGQTQPPSDGKTASNWMIEVVGSTATTRKYWTKDALIKIMHLESDMYLNCDERKKYQPQGTGDLAGKGELSVKAFNKAVPRMQWRAADGVYFPSRSQLADV